MWEKNKNKKKHQDNEQQHVNIFLYLSYLYFSKVFCVTPLSFIMQIATSLLEDLLCARGLCRTSY